MEKLLLKHHDVVEFLKSKGGECCWADADITLEMSDKLLDACLFGLVKSTDGDMNRDGMWKLDVNV